MPLLDPIKNFLNNNYEDLNERDMLLHGIINECEDFLPHYLEIRDTTNVRESIHNKICDLEKKDLRFISLLSQYKLSLNNETEAKKNGDVQYMKFKISLLQKKHILDNLDNDIKKFIKKKAFLVLKNSTLGFYINIIQISIIFISAMITFFESIKTFIIIDEFELTVIPIIFSTYIALILSISRFFKLDIKKEQLSKVIEKYSFIISRLKSKERLIKNFNFKIKKLTDWHKIIENYNKDGIEDFITTTTEESDTIITLKENVYYQNLYFKLKLEKSLQHFNQDRLPDRDNKFYISRIGNLNEYKVRRCQCYCLKFMCNYCCKKTIDYKKIYNILNNKEISKMKNSEMKIKQTRRKRYLCSEIGDEKNSTNIKKQNIVTTFSLINNNNNGIDLNYEDFIHITQHSDLSNSKSINNNVSSKENIENIEKNETIPVNEDLVISIDKETVVDKDKRNSEKKEDN